MNSVYFRLKYALATAFAYLLAGMTAASLVTFSATPLYAATATVVAPGAAVTITSSTDPITDAHATFGTAGVITDKATPKPNNSVIYLAPSGDTQLSDAVTFKLNGNAQTVPIDVRQVAPLLSTGDAYGPSFKALFELFIIAVLLESGLALVFNWKPFLTVFDPKAVNAIVSFAFAMVFVTVYKMDIVGSLLNIYAAIKPNSTDWAGTILTAMIIAGGSAGVNRLFQSLGFRAPSSVQTETQKPPATVAWISVTPRRKKAYGAITVLIGPNGDGTLPAVAVIEDAKPQSRLLAFLLRNPGRFPRSGGHALTPGTYEVQLSALDKNGVEITPRPKWGPYLLAAGNAIDLELEI